MIAKLRLPSEKWSALNGIISLVISYYMSSLLIKNISSVLYSKYNLYNDVL